MAVEVFIKGYYAAHADILFDQATRLPEKNGETHHATDRILRLEQGHVYSADTFSYGAHRLRMVRVRIDRICPSLKILESTECNSLARCWRHKLHIKQTQAGAIWMDQLIIDAGLLTPILARYVAYIHQKRHQARGATACETLTAKSYRDVADGLPIFQTVQ